MENRKLPKLDLNITNRCNFRCLHCFNRSGENFTIENELSDKEVLSFMHDLAKMKPMNFCFCGGEPMLREDLIYQCAKILSSNDIMVSMVTNGWFITQEKANKLLANGVARTQVSLDGATKETYERLRPHKGAHEKAVNAIKYFHEAGFEDIGVAFVPTNFNWHEVEATYNLVKKLAENGVVVKVNSVLIPGVNDKHILDIARKVKEQGASLMNVIPLIPMHKFKDTPKPDCAALSEVRDAVEEIIPVFRACTQCRADAYGVPGKEDKHLDMTPASHF